MIEWTNACYRLFWRMAHGCARIGKGWFCLDYLKQRGSGVFSAHPCCISAIRPSLTWCLCPLLPAGFVCQPLCCVSADVLLPSWCLFSKHRLQSQDSLLQVIEHLLLLYCCLSALPTNLQCCVHMPGCTPMNPGAICPAPGRMLTFTWVALFIGLIYYQLSPELGAVRLRLSLLFSNLAVRSKQCVTCALFFEDRPASAVQV